MRLDDFFHLVPKLRMQDPLARLLGGVEDGILEYTYADAVRLAGHSCPTVASAYWLTWLAMEQLYPDSIPQRGGLRVEFRDDARAGNTGVIATVVQMLTGAAGGTGFKGIRGRHGRVGLIRYSPDLLMTMTFTRVDNRAVVEAAADLSLIPASPVMDCLLERCIEGNGSDEDKTELARMWQERVKHLLLDLARDPGVFIVRSAEPIKRSMAPLNSGWSRRSPLPEV